MRLVLGLVAALLPAHAILGHEIRKPGAIVAGGLQVVALRATGAVETVGSLDLERAPVAMAVHGSRLVALSADGTGGRIELPLVAMS